MLIQTFRGETCGGSVVEENIVSPRSCQQGRGSTFVSMTCVEVEDGEEPAAPSSTATGAGAPQTTPARAKEQYWALRRGDGAARKQAKVQQPLEGGSDSDANPLDAEEGEGVEVEAGPGDRAIDSASRHGTGIHGRDDKREPEVETGPEPEPERPQRASPLPAPGVLHRSRKVAPTCCILLRSSCALQLRQTATAKGR